MSTSTQKLTEQNEDTLKETEASDAYKLAGSALIVFSFLTVLEPCEPASHP
jgi:hypothetical protein